MTLLTKNDYLLNIFNYKLYKYTNKTYIRFIDDLIEENDLKKFNIKTSFLDNYRRSRFYNEVFLITSSGNIEFLHKQNLIKFVYCDKCEINSLLNINIKNQKTYELIKVLEILQKKFFMTNNISDIKYIQHSDILNMHKKVFNTFLSKPIISLILNNTAYRDRDNSIHKLSYLTPKKYFLNYIRIKRILSKYPLATDELIKKELKTEFDIDISTVQVFKIRKKYFIPSRTQRVHENNYESFEYYFSRPKLLINENLLKYKNSEAVYELISTSKINYTYKESYTVYIGSTKNLYKRLNEYINSKGHTPKLRAYIKSNLIYFRAVQTKNYKGLETILLNKFIDSFGELPLLNSNNSKK
jgi:hypothetical protein